MAESRPPDRERFLVYTETSDGKGFKIPDCDRIFKFDKYGGWCDQYQNYYNADGYPSDPPSESEDEVDNRSEHSAEGTFYDEIAKQYQYEGSASYESEQQIDYEEIRNLEQIQKNIQILNLYPINKPLRIFYRNMDYFLDAEQIQQQYDHEVEGIIRVIAYKNKEGMLDGEGYFVMKNRQYAIKLVNLHGKVIYKRPVYFRAETIEELLIDPLNSQQLQKPTAIKKYKPKDSKQKETQKIEEPSLGTQQPTQPKAVKKYKLKEVQQQAKQQTEKKQQLSDKQNESVKKFTFDSKLFETPEQFHNWMKQNGLQITDYKLKKGIIKISEANLAKCNNKHYKGTTISFDVYKKGK